MEIGIQGVIGSFHDQAASTYFSNEEHLELKAYHDFRSLAEAIAAKKLDYGVMAIENTIAGSILPNYALINEYGLDICGEVYIRIHMNLIASPALSPDSITHVYSHPMALLQCAEYLKSLPNAKLIESDDTADSVRKIKEESLTTAAAIASSKAAELYDMKILASNIETNKKNYTRFLILKSRMNGRTQVRQKASLRVITKHSAGNLSRVLVAFHKHGINLTKIQSMPIIGEPNRYAFNMDLIWEQEENFNRAIEELREITDEIKVHGIYAKGEMPKG